MGEVGGSGPSIARNRYWILRHGRSVPNEEGIVVSSVENGTLLEYGLAPEGIHQASSAGETFHKELQQGNIQAENVRICYSPFTRTVDTAKAVADALNILFDGPQCKAVVELRERYFGPTFELRSHEKYAEIWAMDEKDPFMAPEGGESVANVAFRIVNAFANIEAEFQGCSVLLVSHGDPLQIVQTLISAAKERAEASDMKNFPFNLQEVAVASVLSQHRKFALDTGEIRQVI